MGGKGHLKLYVFLDLLIQGTNQMKYLLWAKLLKFNLEQGTQIVK